MAPLRIALVHYHLRPGGVTTVLARTLAALRDHAVQCVVLSGEVCEDPASWSAPVRVLPGLGYETGTPSRLTAEDLERAATDALGGPPQLWHIHNHALGKSASLPRAVQELARRGCPLLLHLHDFAEDGRPGNYAYLTQLLGEAADRLYPRAAHVHYAVLNRRDQSFLLHAGAPADQVHVLPNPIYLDGDAGQAAPVEGPVIYPTRAIRRKNIGEFLLWSLLGPAAIRWQTTLAPRSAADVEVYRTWCALARDWKLPVDFAVGQTDPCSMAERYARARAVVTTSVAEGFGLSFLEPWLAGRPLWGRDLPEITADFKVAGLDLGALYQRVPVPLAWLGEDTLRAHLTPALVRLREAYGRACPPAEVEAAWSHLCPDGTVDFGRLDEPLQRQVLERLHRDADARGQLQPAARPWEQAPAVIAHNRQIVATQFNEAGYGARLQAIYQHLAGVQSGRVDGLDAGALLDQFLEPARFHLLRT